LQTERKIIDLRQLQYFLHAAKTENLTQASSKAWVSQSALSRQIALLETELGVRLFERKARGLKLTEAGVALVRRAEMLLQDADELKRQISATKQEPTGTLRIGTPTSLRSMVMLPFFVQFQQQHPSVVLVHKHGTSKSMRDALAEGEIDIAIMSSEEALEPFVVEPLLSEALCLAGPPNGRLQSDRFVSIEKICQHPLILTSYPNALRIIVDRALAKRERRVQPIIEADTADMMIDLVRSGLGHTVLPMSGLCEALNQGLIGASPIRSLRVEWIIARSRERAQTVAVSRAWETIKEVCVAAVRAQIWLTARLN
jgi:LysR family transcriptional regulator, nitrogen assimilation regulatory protein